MDENDCLDFRDACYVYHAGCAEAIATRMICPGCCAVVKVEWGTGPDP